MNSDKQTALAQEVERLQSLLDEAIEYIEGRDPVGETWGETARQLEQDHAALLARLRGKP